MAEFTKDCSWYCGGWHPLAECVNKLLRLGDEPLEAHVTVQSWNRIVQFVQQAMPLCIRVGNVHMMDVGVVLRVAGSELMLVADPKLNDRCIVIGKRHTVTATHDLEVGANDGWKEVPSSAEPSMILCRPEDQADWEKVLNGEGILTGEPGKERS